MPHLITPEIAATLPPLYAQSDVADPTVYARFTHPDTGWIWLATEYDPEDRVFFGLVIGFATELGYFSEDELAESDVAMDRTFVPAPLSLARPSID